MATEPPRWLSCTALALSLAAWSCAPAEPPAAPAAASPAGPLTLADYFPLVEGHIFAYSTFAEQTGERGLLTIEVARRSGDIVELRSGQRRQLLRLEPQGIAHVTGGYLLREPLQAGASYRGEFGLVHIAATQKSLQVPAGSFERCVETVEELTTAQAAQRSTKAFCPHVGLAVIQTEVAGQSAYLLERAELTHYGPRVDVNAL